VDTESGNDIAPATSLMDVEWGVSEPGRDMASGDDLWHPAEPPEGLGGDGESNGSIVVDTPHGAEAVGPATEDSSGHGRLDTAVVPIDDGIMLVTDVDGDGVADQVAEIDDTGVVTVSHHTSLGRWTVVQESELGQDGFVPDAHAVGTDDSDWVFDEVAESRLGAVGDGQDSDTVWA
jgi:hypothetical protein